MPRLRDLLGDEGGFSFLETVIAAAILVVALIVVLEMVGQGSRGIQSNKVRVIAQNEAIYGVELVKAKPFSSIPTTPVDQWVTQDVVRSGIKFQRIYHYKITDSNHDGFTNSQDYIIATVKVTWTKPTPVHPIEMTLYKLP